jgi:hypothetical protein
MPRLSSIACGLEGNAAKLCSEGSLAYLKMNLLVLVMQLIVLSEDISSRMASARNDSLDKLVDLNNGIWRQVMQLDSKSAKNVCKN